jgi:hypothetical protein
MYTTLINVMPIPLIFILLFLGCAGNDPSEVSSDFIEGNCVGIISNAEGLPIPDASVILVPEGTTPLQAGLRIDSTRSDEAGRFGFRAVQNGNYNLFASAAGQYVMHPSIRISTNARLELTDEVLLPPGRLSGQVELQQADDSFPAIILLMGTNRYAIPEDSIGHFTIPDLAQGTYSVRFLCPKSEFTVLDTAIVITAGEETRLPPVILHKKTRPHIEKLTAAYNPLMMNVVLSWTTANRALVDSFAIYCNREQHITPVRKMMRTDSTVTLDIIVEPIDTFAYQISAISSDGWESEPAVAIPFVKTSAFVMTKYPVATEDNTLYRSLFRKKPYINNGDMYSYSRFGSDPLLVHIDTSLKIMESFSIDFPGSTVEDPVRFDGAGNCYLLVETVSASVLTTSIIVFDRNLNRLRDLPFTLPTGWVTYSFAVATDGAILLYAAYEKFITPDSLDGSNSTFIDVDTTLVTIYDSDFRLVSTSGLSGRWKINEASLDNDKVVVLLAHNSRPQVSDTSTIKDTIEILPLRNVWYTEKITFFNKDFSVFNTIDIDFGETDKVVPPSAGYSALNYNVRLYTGGLFMGVYSTAHYTPETPAILYIADKQKKVIARMPSGDYSSDAWFDHVSGNFYMQCMSSCDYNNVLLKFSVDPKYSLVP